MPRQKAAPGAESAPGVSAGGLRGDGGEPDFGITDEAGGQGVPDGGEPDFGITDSDVEQRPRGTGRPQLHERVTLQAPHGFIDEDSAHRYWHVGHVVSDPEEIELLLSRKAPLVGVIYED